MMDDALLLRRYAEDRDEAAFAELVRRHVDIVFSVARRRVGGDEHLARDVTQQVFVAVALAARTLARHPVLAGWLHQTTRNLAANTVRQEQRRKRREQEAHAMEETLSKGPPEPDWSELAPVLEEALDDLAATDREAVWLRYYEKRSLHDIGVALHLTETAAGKRIERSLDRLHLALMRRGVGSSASALAEVLAQSAVSAAPTGLASLAAAAASNAVAGSATTSALLIFMSKLKWMLAGLLVAGGLVVGVSEGRINRVLRTETATQPDGELERLERDNRRLRAEMATVTVDHPDAGELTRLRDRIAQLRSRPRGVVDAMLRPPQDPGRATPAAAFESFSHAVIQRDLDRVASFLMLDDPEDREAFLANLSPIVRERYRTAERLCAAALFPVTIAPIPDPAVAMQVFRSEERPGGDVRVHAWFRTAAGKEFVGSDTYRLTTDGWAIKPVSLADPAILQTVRERIDPNTGEFVPSSMSPKP